MPYPEAKERIKGRLSMLSQDMKDAKIRQRIDSIEKVDGKLKACFSVSGLPSEGKKDSYESSHRYWDKIFDNTGEFIKYANTFLDASDEELVKICKHNKY